MKMQLREILNLPAIDDQTISGELKLVHNILNAGIQIGEKGRVCWIKLFQGRHRFLWDKQNMKWVRWLWVVKRYQRLSLA